MKNEIQEILFTRDEHLTELTIDRWLLGELSGSEIKELQSHLENCSACAQEVAIARSFYEESSEDEIPPEFISSKSPAEDDESDAAIIHLDEERRRRRPVWVISLAAIACSAALFFAVFPRGLDTGTDYDRDTVQLRGADFSMEVYISDLDGPRRAENGEIAHPGDRIGFRIFTVDGGDIMIVGIDSQDDIYQCFPQDGSDESLQFEPQIQGKDLNAAMRLDEVLGAERIIAIQCSEPFYFDEVRDALQEHPNKPSHTPDDLMGEDCSISEIWIDKHPTPSRGE